jgi:hypothetical protein
MGTWRYLGLLLAAAAIGYQAVRGDDSSTSSESVSTASETSPDFVQPSAPSASGPSGPSAFGYMGPSGVEECDPDMIGFELITGFVYSAPSDLLDSLPGTLMLTDCLEACQSNDTCQSVNYETGLCVLFRSNADSYPGERNSN